MNHAAIDWDEDLPLDPSEEYEAMLTALRRVQNFGLLFVLCSPAEGKKLIQKVQLDLPQKKIEVLQFDQPIPDGNFYRQINDFFKQKGQVDILFIQGLEHSLYDYEDRKREAGWSDAEIYAYSWKGTPRILTNLNQQRERLRDNFKTCFVFLIPPFILNYLIQRAPDFFDWRSGVFKVPMDANRVRQESLRVCSEHQSFEEYQTLTPQERRDKIIEIKNLIDEPYQTSESRANLFVKLGGYQDAENEHRAAIDSYNKAIEIKIKPDDHEAWYYRGVALSALGHNEEAIDSYRKAIDLKPDYYQAWFSLGNALSALGDKEHAIDSYNKAIEIKPDDHEAWYYRGVALSVLGRNEEAIDSYRKAIDLKPDYYQAWFSLGNALSAL
ncbi:MAG TPA: tetratricopeptide repeat protein, partial [Allocoleopsis sp.]